MATDDSPGVLIRGWLLMTAMNLAMVGTSWGQSSETLAGALGRLLYLVHLAVLLWWLLDREQMSAQRMRSWL
jgi:hypothetical protein